MERLFRKKVAELTDNLTNKRVVLAVSGGVDSMVLLEEWLNLPEYLQAKEVIVCHINHQLRPESEEEEKIVRAECQRLGVSIRVAKWQHRSEFPGGLEAAARKFRYQIFSEVMEEVGASYLVTAHHADDQVETMLMKMTRGSSLEGAAGIKDSRDFCTNQLIRPLLSFSKKTIRKKAIDNGIVFCEDDSNFTNDYQRNRIRWKIIPQLEQENQQMRRHFSELSQQIYDVLEVEKEYLAQIIHQYVDFNHDESKIVIHLDNWKSISQALENRLVEYLFYTYLIQLDEGISRKQLHHLQRIIHQNTAQVEWHLSKKLILKKRYNQLIIEIKQMSKSEEALQEECVVIKTKGIFQISPTEMVEIAEEVKELTDGWQVRIPTEALPITIRRRKMGDKIQINNEPMKHQKVSRFLINQKISAEQRNQMWILCDKNEQILAILDKRKSSILFNQSETDKITVSYKKVNRGVDND